MLSWLKVLLTPRFVLVDRDTSANAWHLPEETCVGELGGYGDLPPGEGYVV